MQEILSIRIPNIHPFATHSLRTLVILLPSVLTACSGGASTSGDNSSPPAQTTNHAPVFSGASSYSSTENTAFNFIVSTSDSDGDNITVTLLDTLDGAFFDFDPATNTVSAKESFNYETPLDENGDNIYELTLSATDGTANTTQSYSLEISNETETFFEEYGALVISADTSYDSSQRLGAGLGSAGDIDGDGLDDILVAAPYADQAPIGSDVGHVYLIPGISIVTNDTGDLSLVDYKTIGAVRINGGNHSAIGNGGVSGIPDIDGDDFPEIIIAAPNAAPVPPYPAGENYLIFSHTLRAESADDGNIDLSLRVFGDDTLLFSNGGGARYGRSDALSRAIGDLDKDGLPEVLICVEGATDNGRSGEGYVVFGDAILAAKASGGVIELTTSDEAKNAVLLIGAYSSRDFCQSASAVGDINGDAVADLAVTSSSSGDGRTYLISGASIAAERGLDAQIDMLDAHLDGEVVRFELAGTLLPNHAFPNRVGDIDGDGFQDIAFSVITADTPGLSRAGQIFVLFGYEAIFQDPDGLITINTIVEDGLGTRIDGAEEDDLAGSPTTVLLNSSNPNADSIVFFGAQGAGEQDGGMVFGLRYTSIPKNDVVSLSNADIKIRAINPTEYFSYYIASAGDVNRDGYNDLLVSAHMAERTAAKNPNGEAYVISGAKIQAELLEDGNIDLAELFPSLVK